MAELGAQAAHGPNLHLLRLLLELVRTTPASVRKAAFAEPQQHAFCRTPPMRWRSPLMRQQRASRYVLQARLPL
jgi:hypothetical protein